MKQLLIWLVLPGSSSGCSHWYGPARWRMAALASLCVSLCQSPAHAEGQSALSCAIFVPRSEANLLGPSRSSSGRRSLIFFRARFPDDREDPVSLEEAEQTLTEVNAMFMRISYSQFSLTWQISSVLHLAKARESYEGPGGFDRFLEDVRQAGLAAGYDYRDFDLDVVRHSGVPGFQGGNANLGGRGAQVQAGGAVLLVHELGHNLGLAHANLWVTGSPGISLASPPLPSNYDTNQDPRATPVYPDSALGHETIVGPGYSAEYGDLSDIMGSGNTEFSAAFRHQLGWLGETQVVQPGPGASTWRIQAVGSAVGPADLPRAIRLSGAPGGPAGQRQLWVQISPRDPQRARRAGLELRWADLAVPPGASQLLAPLASAPGIDSGTVLPPGRTFSDWRAGLHITLMNLDEHSNWAEVHVVQGNDPSNQVPTVTLKADTLRVPVDQPLSISAPASDADGDLLSWHWDFGDGSESTAPGAVSKAWRRPGDFAVLLEVSDRRGGVSRAHLAVPVGEPRTWRITGSVRNEEGQPISGVRVHNGLTGPIGEQRAARTFTDSEGRYTLTGLVPGTYTNGAFLWGYRLSRRSPVTVSDADVANIDFVATCLPRVSVAAASEVEETAGITNLFTFTRTGPTSGPLAVLYSLGGTAAGGRDYARPLLDRVTIAPGARSTTLPIDIFDDQAGELDETLVLEVAYPSTELRLDERGIPFNVFYPGWELAAIDGAWQWILTEPSYIPAGAAVAKVIIRDNDGSSTQLVSVTADELVAIEDPLVESSFTLTRSGNTQEPLTVHLATSGSAVAGVDYDAIPTASRFEPGETEHILGVRPIADGIPEPEEQVILTVLPSADYGVELGTAAVLIRDSSVVPQKLTATLLTDGRMQLILKGQPASVLVLENSFDLRRWSPVRTNLLFNSDTAVVVLPVRTGGTEWFRTVQVPR